MAPLGSIFRALSSLAPIAPATARQAKPLSSPLLHPKVTGLGGAAYGAMSAEEDEDPLLRALGYGTLGGVMAPMGAASLARGYKRGGVAGAVTDFTYFSLLSSPDTIARGNLGAVGGAVQAALEKSLTGLATNNKQQIEQGRKILQSLWNEGPSIYKRGVMANPVEYQKMLGDYLPADLIKKTGPEQYTGGVGVGRLFGTPDMLAVNAMTRGGFTREEAARYTLTGKPHSVLGQTILQAQQSFRNKPGFAGAAATQIAPFARVGILSAEKGLQRTPLVGFLADRSFYNSARQAVEGSIGKLQVQRADAVVSFQKAQQDHISRLHAKRKKAFNSLQKAKTPGVQRQRQDRLARIDEQIAQAATPGTQPILRKRMERISRIDEQIAQKEVELSQITMPTRAEQITQQALGAGAGLAGYHSEELGIDPRIGAVAGAGLGPAFLPYQAGRILRGQQERDTPSPVGLSKALIQEVSPLGFRPASVFYDFDREIPRRLIPSGVADVAEALDPAFQRSAGPEAVTAAVERGEIPMPTLGTSAGALAATQRLPGLREQLPEEFMPVDIFGAPRFDRQEVYGDPGPGGERNDLLRALSRTLFPTRQTTIPPPMRQSDPSQAVFRELGLDPSPPSRRVNVPGTDIRLTHTPASAAAVARNRGMARQLTGQLLAGMPALQNMPDGPQKTLLVRRLSEMIQRQISGALSAGTLPLALSQGAQLPAWLRQPQ
jgi:hypothetical protein